MAFYIEVEHYTEGDDSTNKSACHYMFRNPLNDLYDIVMKSNLNTLNKSNKIR